MDDELCNFNVIGIIESKLLIEVSMQWFRKSHSGGMGVDRKMKFQRLLEYLRVERDAVEYSLSTLRNKSQNSLLRNLSHKPSTNDHISQCWLHVADNHGIDKCRLFLSKSIEERVSLVRENLACWSCLMQGHQSKDCPNKVKCDVDGCQRMHNTCLHGAAGLATISHTIDKGTIEASGCRSP